MHQSHYVLVVLLQLDNTVLFTYTGLEIDGFASPKAIHFCDKCESLWPADSLYFWVTANQLGLIVNHFC